MFRSIGLLLGSTLLAIPTMVPSTPTLVTPQVLRSNNEAVFAMPVNSVKEVAPAQDTPTLADPAVTSNQPTYRSGNSSDGNSSGGYRTGTLASNGGYGSTGGYGAYRGYSGGSTGGFTSYRTYRRLPSFTTVNDGPNCPCGCGGNCDGNCGCANCTCGSCDGSQASDYGDDAIVTTPPVIAYRGPGLLRRIFHRRKTLVAQSQATGFSSYSGFRTSGCPSCGN